jgi:hypothetical protein
MPMKCIDQMPLPITIAPTPVQIRRTDRRGDATIRSATDSATYVDNIATAIESAT